MDIVKDFQEYSAFRIISGSDRPHSNAIDAIIMVKAIVPATDLLISPRDSIPDRMRPTIVECCTFNRNRSLYDIQAICSNKGIAIDAYYIFLASTVALP